DFDTANYSTRTDTLNISLDGKANDGAANEHDNVQTEEVLAGAGNDTLTGSSADDFLSGGAGNDVIRGMGGDDDLIGSTGADQLFGGDGSDFIQAKNQDRDTVDGGTNSDHSADFDLASVDMIDTPGLSPKPDEDITGVELILSDDDLLNHSLIPALDGHLSNLSDAGLLNVLGQPDSRGAVTPNLTDASDRLVFGNINVNRTPLISLDVNGVVLTYDPKTT